MMSALQQDLIRVNSRLNEKPKALWRPFSLSRLYFELFVLFFLSPFSFAPFLPLCYPFNLPVARTWDHKGIYQKT